MAGDVGVRVKGADGGGCGTLATLAEQVARGPNGRFLGCGNPRGGNPFASEVHRMRCDMFEAFDSPRWKQALGQLIDKAAGGDLAALKVLFGFIGPALLAGIVEQQPTAVTVNVAPSPAVAVDPNAARAVLRLLRAA